MNWTLLENSLMVAGLTTLASVIAGFITALRIASAGDRARHWLLAGRDDHGIRRLPRRQSRLVATGRASYAKPQPTEQESDGSSGKSNSAFPLRSKPTKSHGNSPFE